MIPELIRRDFSAIEPGRRFVEDITYLPAQEGTMYLDSIVDLYNAEIVAWGISDHPDAALCVWADLHPEKVMDSSTGTKRSNRRKGNI